MVHCLLLAFSATLFPCAYRAPSGAMAVYSPTCLYWMLTLCRPLRRLGLSETFKWVLRRGRCKAYSCSPVRSSHITWSPLVFHNILVCLITRWVYSLFLYLRVSILYNRTRKGMLPLKLASWILSRSISSLSAPSLVYSSLMTTTMPPASTWTRILDKAEP